MTTKIWPWPCTPNTSPMKCAIATCNAKGTYYVPTDKQCYCISCLVDIKEKDENYYIIIHKRSMVRALAWRLAREAYE